MQRLSRADLLSPGDYAEARPAWRARVIAHKQARRVALGEHATLLFEDRLTVQHQVQEMLRIERLSDAAAIDAELAAYNPLVPDGGNLKATLLFEYTDAEQRRRALAILGGIEHRVQACVEGQPPIAAIADEDLARSVGGKTAAVHFLRFEFPPAAIAALRAGAGLRLAIDDPRMAVAVDLDARTRQALARDFD
ncbi:MAG TPA: DUF3501 family protein [Arenimonas sp.]|uniref:DUF3501 family protein n=1 Tax=Arenimonas sp. TaxID=1872635 RepID=UPI002D8050ED|nr:DUF3501 family protein [Arenimonas sp.]HEU0153861.1 DUF3501 family protein [Arenimonas sp.]